MEKVVEIIARNHNVDLAVPGTMIKIRNAPYMDLVIERLTDTQLSVTHYRDKDHPTDDTIADPDVSFYVSARGFAPVAIQDTLHYKCYVEFDASGRPIAYAKRGQADLCRFVTMWANNIARQKFYDATDVTIVQGTGEK
jgi:hypothetical protein